MASARDVEAKQVIYAPYNILPLDSAGESQCIMQFDEVSHHLFTLIPTGKFLLCLFIYIYVKLQIKAAGSALKNISGLNWPASVDQKQQKSGELDLLDWLKAMFGFQACNSRLVLLLDD